MIISRKKEKLGCIYRSCGFKYKGRKVQGLKVGNYFPSLEACKELSDVITASDLYLTLKNAPNALNALSNSSLDLNMATAGGPNESKQTTSTSATLKVTGSVSSSISNLVSLVRKLDYYDESPSKRRHIEDMTNENGGRIDASAAYHNPPVQPPLMYSSSYSDPLVIRNPSPYPVYAPPSTYHPYPINPPEDEYQRLYYAPSSYPIPTYIPQYPPPVQLIPTQTPYPPHPPNQEYYSATWTPFYQSYNTSSQSQYVPFAPQSGFSSASFSNSNEYFQDSNAVASGFTVRDPQGVVIPANLECDPTTWESCHVSDGKGVDGGGTSWK